MSNGPGILNGRGKWISGTALVVSVAVLIIGWVWAASASKTATAKQLDQLDEQIDDHENRIRTMEDGFGRIDENIQWIRKRLERLP